MSGRKGNATIRTRTPVSVSESEREESLLGKAPSPREMACRISQKMNAPATPSLANAAIAPMTIKRERPTIGTGNMKSTANKEATPKTFSRNG